MSSIAALLIYKAICLAVGAHAIWLGYRLFTKGITAPAGDLTGSFNKAQIAIKSGAPGVFFSVVGGFVICFTILKGYSVGANPFVSQNDFLVQGDTSVTHKVAPVSDSTASYNEQHQANDSVRPAQPAITTSASDKEIKQLKQLLKEQRQQMKEMQQALSQMQGPVVGTPAPGN